jgi:hypothetical protein
MSVVIANVKAFGMAYWSMTDCHFWNHSLKGRTLLYEIHAQIGLRMVQRFASQSVSQSVDTKGLNFTLPYECFRLLY